MMENKIGFRVRATQTEGLLLQMSARPAIFPGKSVGVLGVGANRTDPNRGGRFHCAGFASSTRRVCAVERLILLLYISTMRAQWMRVYVCYCMRCAYVWVMFPAMFILTMAFAGCCFFCPQSFNIIIGARLLSWIAFFAQRPFAVDV